MNYVQRVEHWGDLHHPKWIDILRIVLGIFLGIIGVLIVSNMTSVEVLLRGAPFSSFMLMILSHYVAFALIFGGFLLAVGLLTRFACAVQVPVLIGALFLVNWSVMKPLSELVLVVVLLFLLIYFMVIGSGPWSLDRFFDHEYDDHPRGIHSKPYKSF